MRMFDFGLLVLVAGATARLTRLITTDRVPFGPLRAWTMRRPDRTQPVPTKARLRRVRRLLRWIGNHRPIRPLRNRIDALRGSHGILDDGIHCNWCVSVWTAAGLVAAALIVGHTLWFQAACLVLLLSWVTGAINGLANRYTT